MLMVPQLFWRKKWKANWQLFELFGAELNRLSDWFNTAEQCRLDYETRWT